MIIDVSKDNTRKLVCGADQSKRSPHYEDHDGSPVELDDMLPVYVKQLHFVACVQRDGADQNGLVLGPFRNADPAQWTVLSKA